LDFHATVLEVILIAGVGGYIGFLIGLRWGIHLGATGKPEAAPRREARQPSKAGSKDAPSPSAT